MASMDTMRQLCDQSEIAAAAFIEQSSVKEVLFFDNRILLKFIMDLE